MPQKTTPPAQSPNIVMSLPVPPGKKASDYLKAYKSWVYTSTGAIAQEVAAIKLHLFRRKMVGKKVEAVEVTQHEALSLLHDVNKFMTFYDLVFMTEAYQGLTGEAFWLLLKDAGGKPVEVWPLRPDWVKVIPSKEEFIVGYKYLPGGSMVDTVDLKRDEVIHFKDFNPESPYRGRGMVQAAAMDIDIDEFSAEWNRVFFYNSAMPSLVFMTKKKLKKAEIDRFMKEWYASFGGRRQAHKIGFLGGFEGEMKPISQNIKDMDFAEQRKMMRDNILSTFKVPKTVLGITEDVNRANAEATTRAFMERTITPRMRRFVYHLNEFYLPHWDGDLFFDFDDPSPEDVELSLKIYENGTKYHWMTPNEIRTDRNLPPVTGGDTIYMEYTLQPLGSVIEKIRGFFGKKNEEEKGIITLESKRPETKRKFMMPIRPKRLKEMRKDALKKELRPRLAKLMRSLITEMENDQKPKVKGKSFLTEEQAETYWKQMVAKTDVQERKMQEMLTGLFEDQEKEVKQNLDSLKHYSLGRRKGKESSFLFSLAEAETVFTSSLLPYIRSIFADKGREILDFLGIGGEIDLTTPSAAEFLRERGAEFIKSINETTREKLRETLAEGLENDEGIPELKKRVVGVFREAKGPRAEKIARTEVLKATNAATLEGYRQSGVVEGKMWLMALDERTCDWCRAAEEKFKGGMGLDDVYFEKGDTFTVNGKTLSFDYEDVMHPPLHPNCRCTLLPVIETKSAPKKVTKTKKPKAKKEAVSALDKKIEDRVHVLNELGKQIEHAKKKARLEMEAERDKVLGELEELRDRLKEALNEEG